MLTALTASGDAFQRLFIAEVNRKLGLQGEEPPGEGSYGIRQEILTAVPGSGEEIADIVLDGSQATIFVEKYFTSGRRCAS